MALRDLLTALDEEEAIEHESAQRDKRHQAAQIVADARERGAKSLEDAVAAAEAAAGEEARGLLVAARAAARRAVRTARDDALEEVRTRVQERLLELQGSPAGTAAAGACTEEALAALPHATTVRVHPADVAALQVGPTVELVADLAAGGAIAEDDEGRYVDNTYLTRLSNLWPEVRVRLSHSWDEA